MSYSIPPCDLNYSHLEAEVFDALSVLGQTPIPARPIEVVSPIPIVTVTSGDFVGSGAQYPVERTGWRALILDKNGRPVACADIFPPEDTSEEPSPSFAIRGQDAARALANVLQAAKTAAETSSDHYDVSFLTFAPLFVTVLWLRGRDHLFFPTRIGGGERPDVTRYSLKDFLDLIAQKRAGADVTGYTKPEVPNG